MTYKDKRNEKQLNSTTKKHVFVVPKSDNNRVQYIQLDNFTNFFFLIKCLRLDIRYVFGTRNREITGLNMKIGISAEHVYGGWGRGGSPPAATSPAAAAPVHLRHDFHLVQLRVHRLETMFKDKWDVRIGRRLICNGWTSIADPDPHVFGPPGSGSISQRYGSESGSFYHHAR